MIDIVNIVWGMGDAINARTFLKSYCKQLNIKESSISIYASKYWEFFENDEFKRSANKINPRWVVPYANFGYFNIKKNYKCDKCDECLAKNAGINFSFDTIEPLNWNTKLPNWVNLPEKFVTINYGSDNDRPDGTVCIKLWEMEYWEYLVKNIGIPCVQIGAGKNCKEVKGVKLNLVNKLSIKESAEVLKRALFHIDIEGGLPILNQHLGGRSVVLFGPTAIEDKGRSFNLNLRSNTCNPCYEWGKRIPRLCVKPGSMKCRVHCMSDLKPNYVIEQIYKNKWL